ncbi:hypothetical protein [Demetria terragena]|uniref:hypothetical protein n=1 Tax=Demetria terragena TaxID=63959 RepID=UPI00036A417C|nr:hypothetical protein [Demetria terragena]
MNQPEPLARIRASDDAFAAARVDLAQSVTAAREAGHTWAEIGDVLGMTRQAAFKRFATSIREAKVSSVRTTKALFEAAERAVRQLDSGQIATLRKSLTPHALDVISEEALRTAWAETTAAIGPLRAVELLTVEQSGVAVAEDVPMVKGPAVVCMALVHQGGDWQAKVAFDDGDQISGLLVIPPDVSGSF